MKKIRITGRVTDKNTKETFTKGEVIERPESRCKDFIKAGVAEWEKEEPKAEKPKRKKKKKAE